jgi:ABC-2 type transport system permease protein
LIAIFKKDLANYFKSPIAYATTPILLFICGLLFFLRVYYYSMMSMQAMMNPMYAKQMSINDQIIMPLISNTAFLLIFFIPLFTMRLFSEEKKQGTLELLFTYPLTEWQIIFGKLLSCAVVVLMGVVLTMTYPLFLLKFVPAMDWSNVFTGYLGLILMCLSFISLGMWISSLTDSQVVSSFGTYGALLFFWIIGWFAQASSGGAYSKIFSTLCILNHMENLTKGIIDTNDIVYFVCFIGLFLYLTYSNLVSRKWKG